LPPAEDAVNAAPALAEAARLHDAGDGGSASDEAHEEARNHDGMNKTPGEGDAKQ
jgi:hypothetical protein